MTRSYNEIALLVVAGALTLTGCRAGPSPSECARDDDCPAGFLCDSEQSVCRADPGLRDAAHLDAEDLDVDSRPDATPPDGVPAQVTVTRFYASPDDVEYGSSSTLHWEVEHATGCTIDGIALEPSALDAGQRLVSAPASHTYELVCDGPGGPVQAETQLGVTCSSPLTFALGTSYTFASKAELDAQFSGVTGCFKIEGDLSINFSSDIHDLDVLEGLFEVTVDVDLMGNTSLANLDGLRALQRVGEDVYLGRYYEPEDRHIGNPALTSIAGLAGLREVGGYFQVEESPLLTDLRGLEELRSVGGRLLIQHMDGLTSVARLRRLQEVGVDEDQESRYFWLADLPALTDLRGLERLTTLGGYFGLEDLPLITSLDGLQGLRTIAGSVSLLGCDALTELGALAGYNGTLTRLYLEDCDALVDLRGLEGILLTHTLWLRGNALLSDLSVLSGATSSTLSRIVIKDNPALTSLHGLGAITHLSDAFEELECDQVAIDERRCEGALHLRNNALVDLDGLAGLQRVDGIVHLELHQELTDISALYGVTSIGDTLSVVDNDQLASLAALYGVVTLGGELLVEGNDELTELDLDPGCSFGGPGFTVRDNQLLPTSQAQDLAEAWTAHAPSAYSIEITGNAP